MAKPPIFERLAACGQGHVLDHWEALSADERTALERQIGEIDASIGFDKLRPTLLGALTAHEEQRKGAIEGPPAEWVGFADGSDTAAEQRWERLGLDLIAESACAACVLAGGMGTRLGSTFPKGMLGAPEVGERFLPSEKSLFQVYSERILTMQRRAQAHAGLADKPTIWFLVMTGEATHNIITDFFERHEFFGLKREQVIFFQQAMMPCFAEDGSVLMEATGKIATSPDGNAGIYPALRRSGTVERLKTAGVRWVQVFSVDNVLVRVADPVWYGYCQECNADVVVKTVPKRDWSEAVGVVTLRGGVPGVIEYSEIGDVKAQETSPSGQLRYNAANICLQAYSLDFLAGPAQDFPTIWHVARKSIPTIDGKVPGIKLEGFIFDVFEAAKNFRLLQVDRSAEFSAIKNASDSGKPDTPQTALESLSRLHRRWLRAAGVKLSADDEKGSGPTCEVDPLLSYRGEGLESVVSKVDVEADPILVQ